MNNIFDSPREIHRIYDLKGSTYKRRVDSACEPSMPRKDCNFIEEDVSIHLKLSDYLLFCKMVEVDSDFLMQNDLIDYSLLLGIHD